MPVLFRIADHTMEVARIFLFPAPRFPTKEAWMPEQKTHFRLSNSQPVNVGVSVLFQSILFQYYFGFNGARKTKRNVPFGGFDSQAFGARQGGVAAGWEVGGRCCHGVVMVGSCCAMGVGGWLRFGGSRGFGVPLPNKPLFCIVFSRLAGSWPPRLRRLTQHVVVVGSPPAAVGRGSNHPLNQSNVDKAHYV